MTSNTLIFLKKHEIASSKPYGTSLVRYCRTLHSEQFYEYRKTNSKTIAMTNHNKHRQHNQSKLEIVPRMRTSVFHLTGRADHEVL